jgi:hypothetical protein
MLSGRTVDSAEHSKRLVYEWSRTTSRRIGRAGLGLSMLAGRRLRGLASAAERAGRREFYGGCIVVGFGFQFNYFSILSLTFLRLMLQNILEDALCFLKVWSAQCLNLSTVTRAHVPRQYGACDGNKAAAGRWREERSAPRGVGARAEGERAVVLRLPPRRDSSARPVA